MGLDLLSALMIQGNEVMVDTYSDKEKIGYGFIVYMLKEGEIHTKIVSTLPHTPYKSSEEAKEFGDNLVKQVKEMDLMPQKSKLEKVIGSETSETVSEIIDASKN